MVRREGREDVSFFDKARQAAEQARQKAAQLAAERGDTIRTGLEKASQAVDQRTGGKYSGQIAKATQVADTRLTGLAAEHAAATRQDPVSAEARVVTDADVAAEGLRPPTVDERDDRSGSAVPQAPTVDGDASGGPARGSSR